MGLPIRDCLCSQIIPTSVVSSKLTRPKLGSKFLILCSIQGVCRVFSCFQNHFDQKKNFKGKKPVECLECEKTNDVLEGFKFFRSRLFFSASLYIGNVNIRVRNTFFFSVQFVSTVEVSFNMS